MRWINLILITALVFQMTCVPCIAQGAIPQKGGEVDTQKETSSLAAGSRVRIKVPTGPYSALGRPWLVGSIVALDAETLVLKTMKQTTPLEVPLTSVTKFEVSRGKKRNIGKGAGMGAIFGSLFGAGLGVFSGDVEAEYISTYIAAVVVLGAFGAVLGTLLGSVPKDQWEKVPLRPSPYRCPPTASRRS